MKTGRKMSGGRYHPRSKSRKYNLIRVPRIVKLRATKRKNIRIRGGEEKTVLLSCDHANVIGSNGKTKVVKIKTVVETGANHFWARQNRMIKGAVIETELGKARITNRPGQEGCINAILLQE